MKKFLSLFLCLTVIVLSLAGCSKPGTEMTEANITKTVDTAISALKDFDTDKLNKYVDSSTLDLISTYADEHDQIRDLGKAIFANLEYEIKEIDIENETVTLSVKNKDLYDSAKEFANDLKQNYTGLQLLTKLSNEGFLDRKLGDMQQAIDACEMQESATDITLNLEATKKNLVLVFEEQDEDAISGGALGAVSGIFSGGSALSGILD